MAKNGNLLQYWKTIPSPVQTTPKSREPARPKLAPPNFHRAAHPAESITISSSSAPDSPSSDGSFPDSPIRPVQRPPREPEPEPEPEPLPAPTRCEIVLDSDDDADEEDADEAESLQSAARRGQLPSSCASSSIYSSIQVGTPLSHHTARKSDQPPSSRSSTPPTKRRANTLPSSPLALRRSKQVRVTKLPNPPRHRFDMQALLRHAAQDEATEAAARRVSAAFRPRPLDGHALTPPVDHGTLPTAMIDTFMALGNDDAGLGLDNADPHTAAVSANQDRLRRAFGRTELAAAPAQWYFFKEHFVPSPTKKRSFPKKAADGRWKILGDADLRQDLFAAGVVSAAVTTAAARLPDELFLWVLAEAAAEPRPALRSEYAAILRHCPEQVRRFVDAERLLLLFQRLGPRWESIDLAARLELVPAVAQPYPPDRDWTGLRALLALLAVLAPLLAPDAGRCATKILLRLGIDGLVEQHVELLLAFQDAVRQLVQRVSADDWGDYAHDVCASLHASIQKPALRWQVLACLPADVPACHELRRRLAATFLFDDPERAREDPTRHVVGGQGLLARLAVRDELVVTPDTNFADLVARINMLDVYVDDAGREAVLQAGDRAAAVAFDADVDALAHRLQAIGRRIEATSGGHVTRLESKTALDRAQIRLTHAVRTRKPGRRNMFGSAESGYDDDSVLPRQKDIRSFFLQTLARNKERIERPID